MKSLSHVQLFATPWTIAYQAPPSMEFSRQEYWGRLPFPSPEDLSDTGIEARSPTLQADAYHLSHQGKSTVTSGFSNKFIFGCAGCFLQYTGFPSCGKWGLLSSCGVWASHCEAQALGRRGFHGCGTRPQQCGSRALVHTLSSCAAGA